ncbi:MAG: HAD-IIIA family hydrolase [Deltaproteobacteria bacterium]|nr:HAD-IIIA family hydrolase [Deltaproteobacteria bacterium]
MAASNKKALATRLKRIKLLVLDVDGVLTDGSIIYNDEGIETKVFHVRDGHGIKMLMSEGIDVALLTARSSRALLHRAKDLNISLVFQGRKDKLEGFMEILGKKALLPEEAACVGDDVVDLPLLRSAGLSVAVRDGVDEVKSSAHYITRMPGGRGAIREVTDMILKAQGKWKEAMKRYLK